MSYQAFRLYCGQLLPESHLLKGENLRQYQLNDLGQKQKCVFENIPTSENH